MLMIRLQRVGQKNQPSFRLVLTDSKNSTKSGKFLEILGSHNFQKDGTILKADRIKHWISVGAQVSDTAHNLLLTNGVITGKKKNVLPKKTVAKKEEVVVEEAPAPTPASVPEPKAEPVEEAPAPELAPSEEPSAPVEETPASVAPAETEEVAA